jgi:hypothetical protein
MSSAPSTTGWPPAAFVEDAVLLFDAIRAPTTLAGDFLENCLAFWAADDEVFHVYGKRPRSAFDAVTTNGQRSGHACRAPTCGWHPGVPVGA